MSEEIIDLKDVLERVQDDKELLAELFDIYQEDFVVKRQALGEAITAKDITKIKEIAHSMKGSSGNISANFWADNCFNDIIIMSLFPYGVVYLKFDLMIYSYSGLKKFV